jgi:uncharacterized protein YdaU (DUF1376 family)
MTNAWSPFYWRDYIADTGHLSLEEHGAYLLLMAHYYSTGRPLPANTSILHRVCRCTNEAESAATDRVLREFFVLDGGFYRHKRIDRELAKAADISEKRRTAANAKHKKSNAVAGANAEQVQVHLHTQSQPQPQPQSQPQSQDSRAYPHPTLEDVIAYCRDRNNELNPVRWFNHYTANGWKVGKAPMKDWKSAVRTWETNGDIHGQANSNRTGNRAQQRQADTICAVEQAKLLLARGTARAAGGGDG